MESCTIIGITDSREQWFSPEVRKEIADNNVFSGGKRHHEIMDRYIAGPYVWIDITVPVSEVLRKYEQHRHVVIFASGDPLFFGFANTVRRECPNVAIKLYPAFNSLQVLAHRLLLPYEEMRVVSLTGRPWDKFDAALIRGERMIGILTDRHNTPEVIAERMVEYGYDNYQVHVGECLGNEERERITIFESASDIVCAPADFDSLCCIIICRKWERQPLFGIPEEKFELLDGRVNMITKASVRLATISALSLSSDSVFWDIGFCTGSVSIEVKAHFPDARVYSFEQRAQCEKIIETNMKRFGVPGIKVFIGDFLDADIADLPSPDAVFIGGHGGKMSAIVGKVCQVMGSGGRIVLNAVSENSERLFHEACRAYGLIETSVHTLKVDDHNPIKIMRATKP